MEDVWVWLGRKATCIKGKKAGCRGGLVEVTGGGGGGERHDGKKDESLLWRLVGEACGYEAGRGETLKGRRQPRGGL